MLRGWSKNLEGDSNIESHILTCLSSASFRLSSAEGDKSTTTSGSKQRVSAKTKEMVYYNFPLAENVISWPGGKIWDSPCNSKLFFTNMSRFFVKRLLIENAFYVYTQRYFFPLMHQFRFEILQ